MKRLMILASLAPLLMAQAVTPGPGPITVVSTTGPASLTGTTAETTLAALRIPAGSMGANGMVNLECMWTYPNSANTKTLTYRFTATANATSGGVMGSAIAPTTTAMTQTFHTIHNTATNAQALSPATSIAPFSSLVAAMITLAVDTTADSFINVNGTLQSGAETLILQHCTALIMRAP